MQVSDFILQLEETLGIDCYYGVPDSLLRALCDELLDRYGMGEHHVIAANEGGAVGLAAGHYLASGNPACVYMQNSGIGNAVNPICSLLNGEVYGIPALFVVGWRGEPGVHDEPQHVFQGKCSQSLLETIGVPVKVLRKDADADELAALLEEVSAILRDGGQAALLVQKGALERDSKTTYASDGAMSRERAVEIVTEALPQGTAFVSTTGKLSRELFEIRERTGADHVSDFLTVGSMGHSSMIGLGVSLAQPERLVCVLDGDGASLMHMGSMAVLAERDSRMLHVLVNNGAHDSVGGMPLGSSRVDWQGIARACGYKTVMSASTEAELREALAEAACDQARHMPAFLEVKVNLESRADLGRPTTSARDNGAAFRDFLQR